MSVVEQHKVVYSYIGQRIRQRRKMLRLSQAQLAEMMGFSYQQMQKYETGSSQVSAGKLLLFSKILNVPPGYFYDGIKLEDSIGKGIESDIIQKTRTEPLRILLIEDNAADVIFFKRSLDSCSERAEVQVLHNTTNALDFLKNHDVKFGSKLPDIVVLGILISKPGSVEFLKTIKKNPKTMALPIVVLSNSISVKDMIASYKAGASGFIQKSVDIEDYSQSMEIVIKYWAKTVALPCN